MSAETKSPNRWALLVGINEYPRFDGVELSGCVNDVNVMREALISSCRFPAENVEVLTDAQATRDGILAAMERLTELVGQGDLALFHYSGHGSRMTDREGDEPDGWDQTIVPTDSGRLDRPNRDITDDEIYDWLMKLTAKAGHVTVILDSCHSGAAMREGEALRRRQVPDDCRPVSELPPSPVADAVAPALRQNKEKSSGWLPLNPNYVLLAGCSCRQSSNEKDFGGVAHGALTYFLVRELTKARPGLSYRDVFERVAARMKSQLPNQEPQLEGDRDRELFGLNDLAPMTFVPVTARSGDAVTLGAGLACGLVVGSEWLIHPKGTKEATPTPLAKVRITSVSALEARGQLFEERKKGSVAAGDRAVEHLHQLSSRPLAVALIGDPKRVAAVEREVVASPLLRMAKEGEQPDLTLRFAIVRGDSAPEVWTIFGADGEPQLTGSPKGDSRGGSEVLADLEKWARFRRALDLRSDDEELAGRIKLTILRYVEGEWLEPERDDSGEPVLYEGDRVGFSVETSCQELYVYVLDFGLTGSVSQLYPERGVHQTLQEKKVFQGAGRMPIDGKFFDLTIPADLPEDRRDAIDVGRETLKLFASTKPANFETLFQSAVWRGGPARSLNDALQLTFGGGQGQLAFRTAETEPKKERWATLERSFRVRRRGRLT